MKEVNIFTQHFIEPTKNTVKDILYTELQSGNTILAKIGDELDANSSGSTVVQLFWINLLCTTN